MMVCISEHTRFVYGLQDASASDESDELDSYSDDSSSSRRRTSHRKIRNGRTRMSIITGQYFDIPRLDEGGHGYYDHGNGGEPPWGSAPKSSASKRKFFQSAARWDSRLDKVLVDGDGINLPGLDVASLMISGGRSFHEDIGAVGDADEMEIDDEGEDA